MNNRKWILLAEDNSNDADLALRALTAGEAPVEVIVVEDGNEVLDCLYHRQSYYGRDVGNPSLLLLDLKMPRVDGLEVLRQIKLDPRLKSIPVVVFTSSREEADLVRSYDLSANAYVVKPLDFREFVAALAAVSNFWMHVNEPPPAAKSPGDSESSVAAAV